MTPARRSITALLAAALACGPASGDDSDTDSDTASSGTTTSPETTTDAPTGGDTEAPAPACAIEGDGQARALAWTKSGADLPGAISYVAGDPAGAGVIVGRIDAGGTQDVFVQARDGAGAPMWQDVYAGAQGLEDHPLAASIDAAGFTHVLVREAVLQVIAENGETSDARLVVLRYAPDGAKAWRWEREREPVEPWGSYWPSGTLRAVGERIFVLETSHDEPIRRLELDASGNLVGDVELESTRELRRLALGLGPDGAPVVAGMIENPHNLWVGRFGPDGAAAWSDRFGSLDDDPGEVTAGPDGEVWLTWSTSTPQAMEHRLRRYDGDGAPAWTELLTVTASDDLAAASAVRCDGALVLVGRTEAPLGPDVPDLHADLWAEAFARDGQSLWRFETAFPPPVSGGGSSLAVDLAGDVIVGGSFRTGPELSAEPWLGRLNPG